MKTVNQILVGALFVCIASTATAQDKRVSPVYIPGARLDFNQTVKNVEAAKSTRVANANNSIHSKSLGTSSIIGTSTRPAKPIMPSTSIVGQSGCDSGCGCESGGCSTGCGCDRVGRSFFGRVRDLIPIKVNFNRGDISGCCDEGCSPGNCEILGGRFAQFLPVQVRMCSNHNCKYVSVFGGYVDLEDYDGVAAATRLIQFNGGWQLGLKRGRIFDNGLRLESEFSYRHNTADDYSLGNFVGPDFVAMSTVDATGSVYQISTMTNVLKDLNALSVNGTTPYVGFGLGGVYADGDIETALPTADNISDYAFAYQLIVGLSRQISSNVNAFAEYKYFGSSGVEVENSGMAMAVGEFDLQSNNVIFGLQFIRPNR